MAGLPLSMGSPLLAAQIAPHDSAMVARMKAAGGIVIGKSNVPEFGLGSHTYNPVFGTTRNAWDADAQRRRLQRRRGGVAGAAAAAGGRRQRHDGLAAQPRRLGQRLRPAPEPGARALQPARRRRLCRAARHRRADGPHGARRGHAAVGAGRARCAPAAVHRRRTAAPSPRPLQPAARGLRIGWLGRPGRPPAFRARHPAAVRKRAEALRGAGREWSSRWRCGYPLRRGLADLADLAALPGGRHAGALRRRPEEARAAQARGAVGIRPGPGPERPAGLCRQPEPHALLPPHGEPVRALRPAGAAERAGLALPGRMDLAARGGRAARWTPTTAGWRW